MKTNLMTALALSVLVVSAATAAETKREINAAAGETLTIKLKTGGEIRITGSDRSSVAVTATYDDDQEVSIERVADGVSIKAKQKSSRGDDGVKLEIAVPRRFNTDIDTMGGDITIIDVEGRIAGKTMGGELELTKLKGELALQTMGGDVSLTDSDVDGRVTTMGGDIEFRNVVGEVNGKSMGGDVTYDNVRRRDGSGTGKSVVISTQGGSIDVPSAPSGADVSTMGGDINVKSAKQFVRAKTMGGEITIGEVDGSVDATTMGGEIKANVVGSGAGHDVALRSMGGDITLTLPASFSGAFDVELAYTKNSSRDYTIRSDFPLTVKESPDWDYDKGSPRKVITGTGGSGSNKVRISTINGNVVIRKK